MVEAKPSTRWTAAEIETLRAQYRSLGPVRSAELLGRTPEAVHSKVKSLGLAKPRIKPDAAFQSRLRELNGQGYPDRKIAEQLGCSKTSIEKWRKRLELPSHKYGEHFKARQREAFANQCASLGIQNLGEIQLASHRRFAAESGWPADLRPRAVQILNALSEHGPMTQREIADVIGMPWNGPNNTLASNDPEGTYLANLMGRGLVVRLGRLGYSETAKNHCWVYSLSMIAERRFPDVAG